jgi:hypothetical protein
LDRQTDLGGAIESLKMATEGGATTAWFIRLRRVLSELRGEQAERATEYPWQTWDEWIRDSGVGGVERAIDRCRMGVAGTHDQRAEALELLARVVGVVGNRPQGQGVSDATWNWPTGRRIERRLWEVKTGAPDAVPRGWIDQALGQLASHSSTSHVHVVACISTSLETLDDAARRSAQNLCIVHYDLLDAMIDLMGDRLLEYAKKWGRGSTVERGNARAAVERRLPDDSWLERPLAPSGGRVLRRRDVQAFFP